MKDLITRTKSYRWTGWRYWRRRMNMRSIFYLIVSLFAASGLLGAANLTVVNTSGSVSVVAIADNELVVGGSTATGAASAADLDVVQNGDDIRVVVRPRDSTLDLLVLLPLGYMLAVNTEDGDISVEGMVALARLTTKTGALRVKAPLRGIQLRLDAADRPEAFVNPDVKLFGESYDDCSDRRTWCLQDRLTVDTISYGKYEITAESPRSLELENYETPADWPLKFHWEAGLVSAETVERTGSTISFLDTDDEPVSNIVEGVALFRSDVREVKLSVGVTDSGRKPATGLKSENFRIDEEGIEQQIVHFQSGDAAFNMAIVLDMSGSSRSYRGPLQAATRRLVEMVRPGDRVAIYALAHGMFQVLSPLTADREAALAVVENLPTVGGASPLFDIVTLSYAQELRQLPGQRNAMIVISDGQDNQFTGGSGPSVVSPPELRQLAAEMATVVYPVVFPGEELNARGSLSGAGVVLMQQLAAATGGRVFAARSIQDLARVFPLLEAELRSVYTLGYSPYDQNFDGRWRAMTVSVDQPELNVRVRPGYFAK